MTCIFLKHHKNDMFSKVMFKIKKKSIEAYKEFKSEIDNKIYPETKHDIEIMDDEFKKFIRNK